MDDIGWCPMPGCKSHADLDKLTNQGRCQHCEFLFCIDCKNSAHPFRRCQKTRVDLDESLKGEIEKIKHANKAFEEQLNDLYFKYCTKKCVKQSCGVRFTIDTY